MEMYDVAIVGSGPAGLSAALTAKARNVNYIWFGQKNLSIKVEKAEMIHNYPGLTAVSGQEMSWAFSKQMDAEGLVLTEETITSIQSIGKSYALFAGAKGYQAKSVILALGMAPATTLAGEAELLGSGVSYCATCDGKLYEGREIAVVITDGKFEEELEFLADLAKTVHVFPSPAMALTAPIWKKENLILHKEVLTEVLGSTDPARPFMGKRVSAVKTKSGEEIPVDGLFCLKDSFSPVALVKGLTIEEKYIAVDRHCATNLPGLFAAGDCTGRPYQYAKAVGEGNVAMHSALEYIHGLN